MKTCCFFGHKEIWDKGNILRSLLQETIENLMITENVEKFYFGRYGQFDSLCHDVVNGLKLRYPHIRRIYVLAYYRPFDMAMKDIIADAYDDTLYPPLETVSQKFAITYRNQQIIDMSSFCIFYVNHDWGGAWKTMQYAKRKKKTIINLGKLS